jgi:hypothetical protein
MKAFEVARFGEASRLFLDSAWATPMDPGAGAPVADLKGQYGERYPRYLTERKFAIFLNRWMDAKARLGKLDHEKIRWHLGIDLDKGPKGEPARIEVHAVRPTVRLRADGRSRVELLIVLAQKKELTLLADPADKSSVMRDPFGKELTFVFRGGSTLIVDPEAASITYSVAKNISSERRQARHMAFLRHQLASEGSMAIARYGLTGSARAALRRLEPFALVHTRSSDAGTY